MRFCRGMLNATLAQAYPKMLFKHSSLPKHPELVGSYCSLCGKLVAASPNPEILTILERLHECPPIRKQQIQQIRKAA
jgi:hypothetical protein